MKTMPRQNFLSRETFVAATEKQTRERLLTVTDVLLNIQFIGENKVNASLRFIYKQPDKNKEYQIDVSVLPLDDQYTRLCLHAGYANGQTFYSDTDMAVALHDLEAAIQAAVKGELHQYIPYTPKPALTKKVFRKVSMIHSFPAIFYLRKKLS
jgi:hypothetical protein